MQNRCESCKKTIDEKDSIKPFVFMLGDLIDGRFHVKKTLYYHVKCLNSYESYKKRRIIIEQLNQ